MGIRVELQPGVEISRSEFLTYPAGAIAVDGFIRDCESFFEQSGHANYDHHQGNRDAQGSSARQLLTAFRQGLLEHRAFQDDTNEFTATIYANHPDEDVCLAIALARQAHMINGTVDRDQMPLESFTNMASLMDATAGTYPFDPGLEEVQAMAWVFDPYRQQHFDGTLPTDAKGQMSIVNEVGERFSRYLEGRGQLVQLDTDRQLTQGGAGWYLLEERGRHARLGIFADTPGMSAFMVHRELEGNRHQYTIVRRSEYAGFPIDALAERLNQLESGWGGGSNIVASPRGVGSEHPPFVIKNTLNEIIAQETASERVRR